MLHRHALIVVITSLAGVSACSSSLGGLIARASDDLSRSYPLAAAGEVQITNGNGSIEVEGVDGTMVDRLVSKTTRSGHLCPDLMRMIDLSTRASRIKASEADGGKYRSAMNRIARSTPPIKRK